MKPPFLLSNPEPVPKQRLYNGRKLLVWEGKVKVSSVEGWVDNPRIELAKKKLLSRVGQRQLTQDEILDLMKNDDEVKLAHLRDDIIKNGLRDPVTLSFKGKLLDGNRRFFAIKYALESMPLTDPNRQDLESINVYVLSVDATPEDEEYVLVEENFSASLKIEWPDYIKATRVVEANEDGMSVEDIANKFNWSKSKIRDTLKINEIIKEFMTFATSDIDQNDENGGGLGLSEHDAELLAAKNYQYFNEAHKSFFEALKINFDFKVQFFKWIYEEKFKSFAEVRIAYKAWNDPVAKVTLMRPEPAAAKSAKAVLDYNERVVRGTDEAASKIEAFVKFLKEISASEIKLIPSVIRQDLEKALEMVIKMNKAAAE